MNHSFADILIRLTLGAGIGPVLTLQLAEHLAADERRLAFLNSSKHDLQQTYALTVRQADLVHRALHDDAAWQRCVAWCERHATRMVLWGTDDYPALLTTTVAPPPVLWVQGAVLPSGERSCALVGARNATSYGKRVVGQLIEPLVAQDITTVSGGAYGVDGWVHEQTVQAGGQTVVVMGCGLQHAYPAAHRSLFERVVEQSGTLVSPFAPWQRPTKGTFPARNRIIAGLARATVVVQAAARSGALITAQYALDDGREVAAVPGSIDEPLCVGSNRLIAQGAHAITDAHALLALFGQHVVVQQKDETLSEEAHAVLALLDSPQTFDELVAAGHTDPSCLQSLLYELHIAKKIILNHAGMWERCS